MADRQRVFVLAMHRPVEEMESAEILGHLLVLYVSMVRNIKADIGLKEAMTAERSYVSLVTELADRFNLDNEEIIRVANATMDMVKGKGAGNAPS